MRKKINASWKTILVSFMLLAMYAVFFFSQAGVLMGRMIDDQTGAPREQISELLLSYTPYEQSYYLNTLLPLDYGFMILYTLFFISVLMYFVKHDSTLPRWNERLVAICFPLAIGGLDAVENSFVKQLLLQGPDASDLVFRGQYWTTFFKNYAMLALLIFSILYILFIGARKIYTRIIAKEPAA